MSSEMFETVEEELDSLLVAIDSKLNSKITSTGERRKKILKELERDFEEATSLVSQLESEVRLAPEPYKSQLLENLKKDRERVRVARNNYKASLSPSFSSASDDIRRKYEEGKSILERTGESLGRSHVIAIETEEIGTSVINELGTQRESLLRTKGRLHDTDSEISRSRKILRSMYLNVIFNKLILIGIIIVEVLILIILVYLKFK